MCKWDDTFPVDFWSEKASSAVGTALSSAKYAGARPSDVNKTTKFKTKTKTKSRNNKTKTNQDQDHGR